MHLLCNFNYILSILSTKTKLIIKNLIVSVLYPPSGAVGAKRFLFFIAFLAINISGFSQQNSYLYGKQAEEQLSGAAYPRTSPNGLLPAFVRLDASAKITH